MAPDRVQTRANVAADRLRQESESQRTKLAAQASNTKNAVLELDETSETLCVWYWYVGQLKYKIASRILPFLDPGQLTTMESVWFLLASQRIEGLIDSEDPDACVHS
jgi:hypothetical protein